jgi:hypothetical protein
VHRSFVEVHNNLLDLRSSVVRKKYDMKKRGKILKEVNICALTRER